MFYILIKFYCELSIVFYKKEHTMSSYKHKSGSQKRKEKEVRDLEAAKGQMSLNKFIQRSFSDNATTGEKGTAEHVPSTSTAIQSQTLVVPITESETIFVGESNNSIILSETNRPTVDIDITDPSGPSMPLTLCTFFDVGSPDFNIHTDLMKNHEKLPKMFPLDSKGASMPTFIFKKKLANGESVERDWLVWSKSKAALFCLPCKLFSPPGVAKMSSLATDEGWSASRNWHKLYARVPEHEKSELHKSCYVQWKTEKVKYLKNVSLCDLLDQNIKHEQQVWRGLLRRLLDVTLFLAERGLAFRGDSDKIGDCTNGNFLGILELLAKYDPLLNDHLNKVRHSQDTGNKIQVSYLSPKIQNEFINVCGSIVLQHILKEREEAKYFSLIVDATPDSAHKEQTAFLIRYIHRPDEVTEKVNPDDIEPNKQLFEIHERLLAFVDCSKKTGEAIYDLIKTTLSEFSIPLSDCRGQGYDNGSNMKGMYKGVQARLLNDNKFAVYSACACHSLNLCGEQAATSCREAETFFGVVQKLYNVFSSSPQRWEILQNKVGCSLHSTSKTRWSARVESVKPIAAHLPSLVDALDDVLQLNLSAECRRDVKGLITYMRTFDCLILASIWCKVLKTIDIVNRVIQARGATIEVVSDNLKNLVVELQKLRNEGWENIWSEVSTVAENIGWPDHLTEQTKRVKKRKRLADEDSIDEDTQEQNVIDAKQIFERNVFCVILDQVISDLDSRFKSLEDIINGFSVILEFMNMTDEDIKSKASDLVSRYNNDLQQEELFDEIQSLKLIYSSNIGKRTLGPLELLNHLYKTNLSNMFPNLCIALRIFLTIPATVASAERSFSTLKRVKNVLRSTMTQQRLSSLGVLAVESRLAKTINMDDAINDFAARKARKKFL